MVMGNFQTHMKSTLEILKIIYMMGKGNSLGMEMCMQAVLGKA